ncbi:thiamine phosphate synthase [Tabrizicola fusiformis]|uniref:thiamine phosphate synthase n=1 Tax=Tabrizicola sp. SY72 TaxID=2741673 RepID=UPI00157317EA|nr:thiamine phosphate synthase [Tabrizicola sp. SY72]NTT87865.1 thiamine phosphate synthase [Tabrizicola sp. SY72]
MSDAERPQITLITPPAFDLEVFPDRLAAVLDSTEIACLRLSLASRDEDALLRAADACRLIAHERDVAIVIEDHLLLVERLGLDGVHLTDGARSVRKARKDLGADAIVGAFCGTTRHEGMNAGEAGADYAAFGPIGQTALGKGESADFDLFDWWSQVIEVPCIAEGALTAELVAKFGPVTDFFGIGAEIWGADDPVAALKALIAPLG